MAQDLTVTLEDRPGTLADMGEVLGKAGINIDGWCGIPCEGRGVIHILVEDSAGARRALEASGIKDAKARDVLVLEVEDRPGAFGDIARKISNAGVNIDFGYLATRTRLVLGVTDIEKARAAL